MRAQGRASVPGAGPVLTACPVLSGGSRVNLELSFLFPMTGESLDLFHTIPNIPDFHRLRMSLISALYPTCTLGPSPRGPGPAQLVPSCTWSQWGQAVSCLVMAGVHRKLPRHLLHARSCHTCSHLLSKKVTWRPKGQGWGRSLHPP